MNELEFTNLLTGGSVSALGVQRKKNEDEILSLTSDKDSTGNTRVITNDDLAKAETLQSQNEQILAKQDEIKANQLKAEKLNKSILSNRTNIIETNSGAMPLADKLFSRPKSIGTLRAFHGDREVLSTKNGRKEILSAEERALRLGTFLIGCVAGNEHTRREYQNRATNDYGLEYLTMSEGDLSAGGYLVPPEFSKDFIYLSQEFGIFRKYAKNVAVNSNDYRQSRKQSSVTATWEGELATIAASNMTIDQIQVLLKRLSVLTHISNELNADSIIGITDWLVKDAVIKMAEKEDNAGFNGDGTLAYGNTVGIIPGLNAVSSNAGVVLQGTGTAWTAVTKNDIEKLMGALPMFPGMKPKLFCSNAYYRQVLRTLLVNAGGNTIITLTEGNGMFNFDGTEVVISQVLPNTDAGTGTISLLYGDLEYEATFISKGQYTVFQANQGDTNVATNTTSIRIDERVGIINHELGTSSLGGCVVGLKSN